jgi:HK97 family phage portal protein
MAWWRRTAHNAGSGDFVNNTPDGWVIDRPELSWWGSDQAPSLHLLGGVTSPSPVTADEVLAPGSAFPAVTRATSLIVDTLAGVPWEVVKGETVLPSPRWLTDPALARPDLRVSDYMAEGVNPLSAVSFWSEALISALWFGDAFLWVPVRDANGQPVPPLYAIHPLLVNVVLPSRTSDKFPTPGYWVRVSEQPERWERLATSEVIQVRGMGPYWEGRGRGAITGHLTAWSEAVAQRNYSTGIFTAGIPAGYLKVTAPNLTEVQAEALKAKWADSHGGEASRRNIAVLNSVTEFVPIQMPPETAQLTEARRLSTMDVANAFGVEPFMLGLPSDGSTYANIESRMRHFAQFTLLPWARRVESALDSEFPLGTTVRLFLEGLSRGDAQARVTYYSAGLTDGWLTVEEVRRLEGLPALDSKMLGTPTPANTQPDEPAPDSSQNTEEVPA